MPACRYVTTAIPYVNAAPHVGFALEMVQADALARFYRQRGDDVRLLAGTDENSIKNVQAAAAAGVPVPDLVSRHAAGFQALGEGLNLSVDDFIRTSTDPRHRPGAERLWRACAEQGDIYKRAYRGLYCTGCEQFFKASELRDGQCPEHGTKPEEISEENWFFRLSNYSDRLHDAFARHEIDVLPQTRRNEVLAWIESGLEDFSISRSATRARGWGIPVPGDPDQVIYVWFDALANYVTALGYGTKEALLNRYWREAASREHVVGKGITRFHAVYWPAMLLSAGLPLPTRILVHGYVTVQGRKIGKSAGNAVDPIPLAARFGPDALRYYLLRHIRSTEDGDFSPARFEQCYEADLAGQLGNLVHRVLSMIERYFDGEVPVPPTEHFASDGLLISGAELPSKVAEHLVSFAFDRALEAIWAYIAEANRYVTHEAPWDLAKAAVHENQRSETAPHAERLRGVLFSLAASCFILAGAIAPLLPATSTGIFDKLGGPCRIDDLRLLHGRKVAAGSPLFPKR